MEKVNPTKKINNESLYEELVKCIESYESDKREEKTSFEHVSPLLNSFFERITVKVLSNKRWYPYMTEFDYEDYKQDAIIKMCEVYYKFNTDKTNPFAYFTTVVVNSTKATKKSINGRRYNDKISLYQLDSPEPINIQQ